MIERRVKYITHVVPKSVNSKVSKLRKIHNKRPKVNRKKM